MNGRTAKTGLNSARTSRAFKLSATTSAVRAALAVSATMLALAGSGVAYAGNCSVSALNTVSCNGVFTDTIIGFIPTDDLTLVLGDNAPTSVTPAFGDDGVHAVWNNVTVVSYADITTEAADGIYAASDYTVSVTNHGNITTDATLDATANAIDAIALGDVTVVNDGSILTYSNYGDQNVTAVSAVSLYGITSVDNQEGGDILASAYSGDAYGVAAFGKYGATVSNEGSIAASSFGGDATAVTALSKYGDATVTNAGHIEAYSLDGNTTGVYAYSKYASAIIDNSGEIQTGSVYGDTTGVYASAVYGTASVTNSGSIEASSIFGGATGALATSYYGAAEIINTETGTIQATSNYYAIGAYTGGGEVGRITNYGSIAADAHSEYGVAYAYGAIAAGGLGVNLNYGSISAEATVDNGGIAIATGALSFGDAATVVNEGSIEATAEAGYGLAVAYGASAYGQVNGTYNYGSIEATASTTVGAALAYGVNSYAILGSNVYNSATGVIEASASVVEGEALADGINSFAYLYGAYVTNDGSVSATASAEDGVAFANGVWNVAYFLGEAVTTNNGDITATATITADEGYGAVEAIGVYNYAFLYDASVVNNGSISAVATAGGDYAAGDEGYYNGNCVGYCNQVSAIGVWSQSLLGYYSSASIENGVDGEISASATVYAGFATASGAIALAGTAGGPLYAEAYIGNEGSISASAVGQYAFLESTGAQAASVYGSATIVNSGDITGTTTVGGVGFGYATGASATAQGAKYYYGTGVATIVNYGDISGIASTDMGYAISYGAAASGKYASVHNAADGVISASSTIDTWGISSAVGVDIYGAKYSSVVNEGTISASATSHGTDSRISSAGATGVDQYSPILSSVSLVNYGDITATATANDVYTFFGGGAGATGVYQYAKYDAVVDNFGDISGTAEANAGIAGAYGIFQKGKYLAEVNNYAGATISATATSASLDGDYYGGRAVASGIRVLGRNDVFVYNGGEVIASASVAPGSEANPSLSLATAYGAWLSGRGGEYSITALDNAGGISAYAGADLGAASAYGAFVTSEYFSSTTNSGDISAVADADGGYAFAVGSYDYSLALKYLGCDESGCNYAVVGGISELDNQEGGSILADASSDGGLAYAYGSVVIAGYAATTTNAGSITAVASADGGYALAVGSLTNSFYGAPALYNSGSISAEATGETAYATGAYVIGTYGVTIVNDDGGEITAASYGDYAYSRAVSMYSYGYNSLTNSGEITALGDGSRVAVYSNAYAVASLINHGTISGSIQTGNYNDYLYNDGTWNAIQASYFGAGDDFIYNEAGGNIHMTDAAIYMGTYSEYGNSFVNAGTVTVSGDNLIDMGGNPDETLIPSLNPNPFYNYGVIDFQDGHPDDTLTIVGDFAGDGDINVDVSALHVTSDLLYIDGSVVDGTTTINPDVLDTPESEWTEIPVVYVSGISGASNFALGDVGFDTVHTFLTFDFSLISDVDATNATDDVYSLGIEVTGLSDPGVLAASVVPGVQSLANAQVGTWRQRMGVINKFQDSTFSMWARWFQNEGDIEPEHTAANFGNGGNFSFEQKNSGFEVGADFSVSDEFSFGALAAWANADQQLNAPGAGSTEIDADTYGVYATWLSNGFYVDGSYRWMSFTADSSSAAGAMSVEGDAETFNIEAGYAWTLEGGLQIEPQAQYTNTNVTNVDSVTLGQTAFQADDGGSEVGRLGVAFRKGYGDPDNGTLWTPHATVSAVWEMDGENDYAINGSNFVGGTSTDGSSALLEVGLTAQTGNLSVFGGINWQDGGAMEGWLGGQLGIRYTFGHAAPAPAPAPVAPAKTCADLDDDGDGVNNCNDKCPGSAAGQAIGPDGCPVPLTIDLKGVNFDFDKDTLRPDAVAILDEAISILGKYPELKVEVAGHTDAIGTDEYNQALSERRARAVYDYLGSHGIGAERLVGPVGYGESKPIAPNTNEDGSDNPDGRAKNRRTELNVQN